MKKGLAITLLVLLTVGLFVSCTADAIEKLFPEENPPAPETYTVTFDLNGVTGGAAPDTQTISSGEKATNPGDPTFDNHTFAGWYKTKDPTTGVLSDLWVFDNGTVTADITLYAKWTRRIVNILNTVEFPEMTGTDIPANAWVDSSKPNNRVYACNLGLFNALYVNDSSQDNELLHQFYGGSTGDNAEKVDNSYIFINDNSKFAVTFKMTDADKLESIKIDAQDTAEEKVKKAKGTYAPQVSVTGVSLDITDITLTVGDEDGKLTATVLPENATDKSVTWSSSDTSVATVDSEGKVHAVAAGEATITVTTDDGNKTATCTVEVTAAAPTTYTVTFDLNGITGTPPTTQTVEKDGTVPKPTEDLPTLENHTLQWFTDANTNKLSDKWDFDTGTVTADMTLYAKWTRKLESIYSNSAIPKAENNTAPENAWVNGEGGKAFIANSTGNATLTLYKTLEQSGARTLPCLKSEFFIKNGDDYVLDYYLNTKFYGKYTLHMTESIFTSVTYDGAGTYDSAGTDYEVLTGTYTAPAAPQN